MHRLLAMLLALVCAPRVCAQCEVFRGCGTLVQGPNCVLFAPSTIGGLYALDDLGAFRVNDAVWVEGLLDLTCTTTCGTASGCIPDNTIATCPTTVPPSFTFCAGDGLSAPPTTPCPCGNFGAAGHGCGNSVNPAGALLDMYGSIVGDSVGLVASGMPANAAVIFLKGDAADPAAVTFGDGIRCASGSLVRLRFRTAVTGCARYPLPGEPSLSVRSGVTIGSGALAVYQVYYRNSAAFCTPDTFNASDAELIVW